MFHFESRKCHLTSCKTVALHAWPVKMEDTVQTVPGPGLSTARMGDLEGSERGGGGPWPCHTRSASPSSLCATQSEKEQVKMSYPDINHSSQT